MRIVVAPVPAAAIVMIGGAGIPEVGMACEGQFWNGVGTGPRWRAAVVMSNELPAPKFEHFERVTINGDSPRCKQWQGERGTVIWLDSFAVRKKPTQPDQWLYIVHLSDRGVWKTFFQADLTSIGGRDPEAAHLGKRPEISFDTVLEEDNEFAEGSYRLPGEFWKVAVFRRDDVPEVLWQAGKWPRPTKWEREATGMVFRLPRPAKMGRDSLLRTMSHAFGYSEWVQVEGPDSMSLR